MLKDLLLSSEVRCWRERESIFVKEEVGVVCEWKWRDLVSEKEISLSSPTPTEYYTQNIRPPTQLVQQRFTPKIASRQTSLSTLSVTSPVLMSDVSRGSTCPTTFEHMLVFITFEKNPVHIILSLSLSLCLSDTDRLIFRSLGYGTWSTE